MVIVVVVLMVVVVVVVALNCSLSRLAGSHRLNHCRPDWRSIVSADDLSSECSRIATRRYSHRGPGDYCGLERITTLEDIKSALRAQASV